MKRHFRKPLSLLLILAIFCSVIFAMSITANAATDYVVVNDVKMESGKYLKETDKYVSSTKPTSGSHYAYYKDGVLYLYDFDLNYNTSGWMGAIYSNERNLTIELNGTNTITATQMRCIYAHQAKLTIRGSGTMTINSTKDYAVCASKDVEITGGTLNVTAVEESMVVQGNYIQTGGTVNLTAQRDEAAMVVSGNATIQGGTLTVNGSQAMSAADVRGNVTVSGGTVNINAKSAMIGLGVGGTYTQSGGTVNLATNTYAGISTMGTGKVTLTGGDLKVTGTGVGIQTAKADIEIGRCDVYPIPVSQLLSFIQAGL